MSVLPFIALSLFSYPFLYSRVPNNCCGGGGGGWKTLESLMKLIPLA